MLAELRTNFRDIKPGMFFRKEDTGRYALILSKSEDSVEMIKWDVRYIKYMSALSKEKWEKHWKDGWKKIDLERHKNKLIRSLFEPMGRRLE